MPMIYRTMDPTIRIFYNYQWMQHSMLNAIVVFFDSLLRIDEALMKITVTIGRV